MKKEFSIAQNNQSLNEKLGYVRRTVSRLGSVSINIRLDERSLPEFEKEFKVTKEPFGYYKFELK